MTWTGGRAKLMQLLKGHKSLSVHAEMKLSHAEPSSALMRIQ